MVCVVHTSVCNGPFPGEVNGVDYCVVHTSACNQPFHGEVNGVDYCLPIFGSHVINYFMEKLTA